MTTQFRVTQETKAINDFGQLPCAQIYNATLAATTNTQLTVPGGGTMGNISSQTNANKVYAVIRVSEGDEVWVAVNQTADVPAGGSFALDTSEIVTCQNTYCKYLSVGDVLNFYTAGATTSVSVAFYALPS